MTVAESFADGAIVLVGGHQRTFVASPAQSIDPAALERLHELGRGIVVLALEDAVAERLALPLAGPGRANVDLPFTAPVDAAIGFAGGWSWHDRARTMRVAADGASGPGDLRVPGHVHPIRVAADRLLEHEEDSAAAALELSRLAATSAAVALCLVVDGDGSPVPLAVARRERDLARIPFAEVAWLREETRARCAAELAVSVALPIPEGGFRALAHASAGSGDAVIALVLGDPAGRPEPLVHVHSGCLLGDVFGSLLCDCRDEFQTALTSIAAEGAGVLLYAKSAARTGLTCGREAGIDGPVAAGLLRRLGVTSMRLLGAEPPLAAQLRRLGLHSGLASPVSESAVVRAAG